MARKERSTTGKATCVRATRVARRGGSATSSNRSAPVRNKTRSVSNAYSRREPHSTQGAVPGRIMCSVDRQSALGSANDPNAHYGLGNALYHQRLFKEAETEYQQALRLRPDLPEAHCNLGLALKHQGRFAEALDSL